MESWDLADHPQHCDLYGNTVSKLSCDTKTTLGFNSCRKKKHPSSPPRSCWGWGPGLSSVTLTFHGPFGRRYLLPRPCFPLPLFAAPSPLPAAWRPFFTPSFGTPHQNIVISHPGKGHQRIAGPKQFFCPLDRHPVLGHG
jgi:hypothetical protein